MPSKNDFDAEEREFSSRVQLPSCPDLALLYSAREGVLPDDKAEKVHGHLSQCEVCARLFEDLESIDFGTPTAIEAAHIRQRIQNQAPRAFETKSSGGWIRRRWWVPTFALAACAAVGVFVLRPTQHVPVPAPAPQVAEARPLPDLPLTKLAIHVDPTSLLATRGAGDASRPTGSELAKAFQRYQNDDYPAAEQQLKGLAQKYPQDGTVRLYLGVTELFLNHDAQAADDLTMATAHNQGARLADSQWYLAIAELRLKNPDSADPLMHDLCQGKTGYSQRACEIESQLK